VRAPGPMGGPGAKGAFTVKLNVSLIKCGRCGKRYNNPLTHVCVTRMDRKTPVRPSKIGAKLTVKCGRCGRALGNPLTHRCVTRTDFRKRKRAAAKGHSRPASTGNAHEPAECKDDDCPRYGCKMYKQGYEAGYADGHGAGYGAGRVQGYVEGHADGRTEGYAEGYADGAATAEGA
jgi:hypothetical protein